MPDPALCTEAANTNLTIGTFELFVTEEGEAEFEVGNIQTGSLDYSPNIVEHRRGVDNSLDALFAIGRDYSISFTGDEITARNLGMLLNETPTNTVDGCLISLTGSRCVTEYGVRLLHNYPCADRSLEIQIWRAVILADFSLNFEAGSNASFAGVIRALSCESTHPSAPYGQILFVDEECPS